MSNHKNISETVSQKKASLQSRASYLRSQKWTISERVQVACKASFLNSFCKLLIISCTLVNPLASCLWAPVSNGNRTEWSPIRSVIIRVINKIGRPRSGSPICLITTKFVIYRALFKSKHKKFQDFFASNEKKSHLSARVMARTVQLLRHDAYCPIKLSY